MLQVHCTCAVLRVAFIHPPTRCVFTPFAPQACDVLGDAAQRRQYDQELASAASFGAGFT